jgi:hypothetical protein
MLRQALTVTARRHAALRMFFPYGSQEWGACADPGEINWEIKVVRLAPLAAEVRADTEKAALLKLQRCFDPAVYPLFRAISLDYGADHMMLGIAIDHLIFDGASIAVFLRDLEAAYQHLSCGQDVSAIGTSDFTQFCAWEHDWLNSQAAAQARDFWRPIWAGKGPFPESGLPTSQDGAAGSGGIWQELLPYFAVARTQQRFPGGHLSLFSLAAGAVLVAQGELTDRSDVALLHPGSRRSTAQTADMMGYLTNRMLLRIALPAKATLYDAAGLARDAVLDSLEHEMMPFEHLMDIFSPADSGRKPRVSYIYLNVDTAPKPPRLGDATVELTSPMVGDAFGDVPWLHLNLERSDSDILTLSCGYQQGLFAEGFVDQFMRRVTELLLIAISKEA